MKRHPRPAVRGTLVTPVDVVQLTSVTGGLIPTAVEVGDIKLSRLDDSELARVIGGAETVHLYLKANGADIPGE